jgi:hypothetical protein
MRSRWTVEDMPRLAASRGGVCLSQQYERTGAHLKWQCPEGHRWRAVASSVLQGSWCPTCARSRRRLRDSIETMQAIAASKGGRCLSERYIDAKTHLLWECARGHTRRAVPHSVADGTWYRQCAVLDRCLHDGQRRKYLAVNHRADVPADSLHCAYAAPFPDKVD